ncbi:hypothetical protein C8R43DRAFT_958518 [Mycena crocata]|nr:hypothetical protein C8R43DRAFT_958518 [Mycena crocata]
MPPIAMKKNLIGMARTYGWRPDGQFGGLNSNCTSTEPDGGRCIHLTPGLLIFLTDKDNLIMKRLPELQQNLRDSESNQAQRIVRPKLIYGRRLNFSLLNAKQPSYLSPGELTRPTSISLLFCPASPQVQILGCWEDDIAVQLSTERVVRGPSFKKGGVAFALHLSPQECAHRRSTLYQGAADRNANRVKVVHLDDEVFVAFSSVKRTAAELSNKGIPRPHTARLHDSHPMSAHPAVVNYLFVREYIPESILDRCRWPYDATSAGSQTQLTDEDACRVVSGRRRTRERAEHLELRVCGSGAGARSLDPPFCSRVPFFGGALGLKLVPEPDRHVEHGVVIRQQVLFVLKLLSEPEWDKAPIWFLRPILPLDGYPNLKTEAKERAADEEGRGRDERTG